MLDYAMFFPAAIAFGSSAIVEVSGQNCFPTLYGSLGQIRLGPPKGSTEGSTEGSTKVPARVRQGSTGSSSFVVSLVFWGRSVLGFKVPCKVPPRFHQGSLFSHSKGLGAK